MEKKSCPKCDGMFVPLENGRLRAHGPVHARCSQLASERPDWVECDGCELKFIGRAGEPVPPHGPTPGVTCSQSRPVSAPAATVEDMDDVTEEFEPGVLRECACNRVWEGRIPRGHGARDCERMDDAEWTPATNACECFCGRPVAVGDLTKDVGGEESVYFVCKGCDGKPMEILNAPAAPVTPEKGPWFGALSIGACSNLGCRIDEGDRIRADGQGGYECEDCGSFDDEPMTDTDAWDHPTRPHDWQEQASAAAKRHLAAQAAPVTEIRIPAEPGPMPEPDDVFEDPTPREERPAKLNVSGQPPARRDYQKRYLVVDPDLGDFRRTVKEKKPRGITRATTFNKHAQNTIALNGWSKRNVVMGASLRPDILRRAHGLHHDNGKDQREALDRIVDELETAAGAKVAADEGTFLHEFCDQVDAGLKTWEDAPTAYQWDIKRYVKALADAGLEPVPGLIERTTFIREYGGVAGTFDRIFYHRPSGQYIVGDLKTGKTMKYAMDETECQLWTYAHGVNQTGIYDWNTDTWGRAWPDMTDQDPDEYTPITVSETVGVIVHMPVQGPEAGEVYLRFANLERGRAYADLNWAVKSYEKSKVLPFSMPEAPERVSEGPANPTPDDVWTHLFKAVQSREEANELWSRAVEAGVGDAELASLVAVARRALTDKG